MWNLSTGFRNPINHLLRSVFEGVPEFFKHYYYYIYNVVYVQRKRVYYTIYVVSLCIQTAAKQRWFRIKYAYSNGVSNFNFLTAWNSISSKEFLKPLSSRVIMYTKGQIIWKWFFGVFDFLQKSNENKSTWGVIVVKSNSFVHFLEEIGDTKNHFELSDL